MPEDQVQLLLAVFPCWQRQADRPGKEPDRERGGNGGGVDDLQPVAVAGKAFARFERRPDLTKQEPFGVGRWNSPAEDGTPKTKMFDAFPAHDSAEPAKP